MQKAPTKWRLFTNQDTGKPDKSRYLPSKPPHPGRGDIHKPFPFALNERVDSDAPHSVTSGVAFESEFKSQSLGTILEQLRLKERRASNAAGCGSASRGRGQSDQGIRFRPPYCA
jgi:hypothetical protein